MHITMVGDDRRLESLAMLATRAANTVFRVEGTATDVAACSRSDMVIVAGDRSAATEAVARLAPVMRADVVVVDATTVEASQPDGEWMPWMPSTRIVRAFASIPAEAFTSSADLQSPSAGNGLAAPMVGDDPAAKEVVAEFMRQIGIEPFDVGPLAVSYVMEPGGHLWGKAVDGLDMLECIGWLSGDG